MDMFVCHLQLSDDTQITESRLNRLKCLLLSAFSLKFNIEFGQ